MLIIHEASFRVKFHGFVDHDILLVIRGCHVVHAVPPGTAADFWLADTGRSCSLITSWFPSAHTARHRASDQQIAVGIYLIHQSSETPPQVLMVAWSVAASRRSGVLTMSTKLVVTETLRVVLETEVLVALAELSARERRRMNSHIVKSSLIVADS